MIIPYQETNLTSVKALTLYTCIPTDFLFLAVLSQIWLEDFVCFCTSCVVCFITCMYMYMFMSSFNNYLWNKLPVVLYYLGIVVLLSTFISYIKVDILAF